MTRTPYERLQSGDLILRDELAIDRTILANERTLLSYIRTGIAFAITGAGSIHLFDSLAATVFGSSMMVVALGIVVLGIRRFRRVAVDISRCRTLPVTEAPPGGMPQPREPAAVEHHAGRGSRGTR